jgi:hypothetical protein
MIDFISEFKAYRRHFGHCQQMPPAATGFDFNLSIIDACRIANARFYYVIAFIAPSCSMRGFHHAGELSRSRQISRFTAGRNYTDYSLAASFSTLFKVSHVGSRRFSTFHIARLQGRHGHSAASHAFRASRWLAFTLARPLVTKLYFNCRFETDH